MGNVSSRPDENPPLYIKDQNKFSIASVTISNIRQKILLNIVPNAFPATKYLAKRDLGDDSPVDFIQDPEPPSSTSCPSFILRLTNEDEIIFRFVFIIHQVSSQNALPASTDAGVVDTSLNNLTLAYASNSKELDNLVTREFHANPNLHLNSNVQLIGNYSTDGNAFVQFEYLWTWRPPKTNEDKGGGWRNSCSFLEYDQRAHRLNTLASFSFWVQNTARFSSPKTLHLDLPMSPRLRVPSSQSVQSRASDSEGYGDEMNPPSPDEAIQDFQAQISPNTVTVDVSRPGEDMTVAEDGPLFRATMKALEQKTGNMRARMKKVLRKAEAAQNAQMECSDATEAFMNALREASASNGSAIQPALEHYFEKIARQILMYEKQNANNLQRLIIEPLSKLYNYDIKQAEAKKKDFEDESRDFYAYVSRYLGQRQDSLKEKKRAESDSKYQIKRRNFELKRFDYSSFMQDLHGGRKEQEFLSQLTKYADTQTRSYLSTAKKVEELIPQLEALIHEVKEADKEFQLRRTEREEKRRVLERSSASYIEPEISSLLQSPPTPATSHGVPSVSDVEIGRSDSVASTFRSNGLNGSPPGGHSLGTGALIHTTSNAANAIPNIPLPATNKFKGIRDLEEKNYSVIAGQDKNAPQHRKEGLLWALSKPGSHMDPRGMNKQAWHKFWIVLDQGKLSEYSNWKQKLDLHMEPIDLRMASVREARNAERRFCFEIITPQFKRMYQATSEEDMNHWIDAINNAIQSAVEGKTRQKPPPSIKSDDSQGRDISSALTGKSSSYHGSNNYIHHHSSPSASSVTSAVGRRITVGGKPGLSRVDSNYDEDPSRLLLDLRATDQGNCYCADCNSTAKVEWVSINLGIILCIECSGIHRSLGTHISKIRSLTLDTRSFTPDMIELLRLIGNRISNMVWEAKLVDRTLKPQPSSTREQRLKFITAKYVEHRFVEPISPTLSSYSTPDETLIGSIKRKDIQGVLYGIALRANVNAHDLSRNTHSIFLALAAVDPASPSSQLGPPKSPALTPSSSSQSIGKITTFPVAELLIQNGAEVPSRLPQIPLGERAMMYLESKGAGSGCDTVPALPIIGKSDKEREAKEKERLLKRGSVGGRFAGKF